MRFFLLYFDGDCLVDSQAFVQTLKVNGWCWWRWQSVEAAVVVVVVVVVVTTYH